MAGKRLPNLPIGPLPFSVYSRALKMPELTHSTSANSLIVNISLKDEDLNLVPQVQNPSKPKKEKAKNDGKFYFFHVFVSFMTGLQLCPELYLLRRRHSFSYFAISRYCSEIWTNPWYIPQNIPHVSTVITYKFIMTTWLICIVC